MTYICKGIVCDVTLNWNTILDVVQECDDNGRELKSNVWAWSIVDASSLIVWAVHLRDWGIECWSDWCPCCSWNSNGLNFRLQVGICWSIDVALCHGSIDIGGWEVECVNWNDPSVEVCHIVQVGLLSWESNGWCWCSKSDCLHTCHEGWGVESPLVSKLREESGSIGSRTIAKTNYTSSRQRHAKVEFNAEDGWLVWASRWSQLYLSDVHELTDHCCSRVR